MSPDQTVNTAVTAGRVYFGFNVKVPSDFTFYLFILLECDSSHKCHKRICSQGRIFNFIEEMKTFTQRFTAVTPTDVQQCF